MSANVIPCKYCQAWIRFFRNSNTGNMMPADASPITHDGSPNWVIVADGNHVICTRQAVRGEIVYRPHWLNENCPNHKQEPEMKPDPRSDSKDNESDCFPGWTLPNHPDGTLD